MLRVSSGDAEGALALIRDGLRRYPNDILLRRAQADYHYLAGTEQALPSRRAVVPLLFTDPPKVDTFSVVCAPIAVFLSLRSGDTGRASKIAAAVYAFLDQWAEVQKDLPDRWRAQMAAALGDRASVVKHLAKLYDSGSVLPAWIPTEPMFKPYLHDPEIAVLLTKHAERRAEWRQQLAAEGL